MSREVQHQAEQIRTRGTPLERLREVMATAQDKHRQAGGQFACMDTSVLPDLTDIVTRAGKEPPAAHGLCPAAILELQLRTQLGKERRYGLVCHTTGTTWFFDRKATGGVKLAIGELPRCSGSSVVAETAKVAACRFLLCPVLIICPDFNELMLGFPFAHKPDCPEVLRGFEVDFQGFLATPLSDPIEAHIQEGKLMTLQCETCGAQTTQVLTRCEGCQQSKCPACVRERRCPCASGNLAHIALDKLNLAAAVQASDEMTQLESEVPCEPCNLTMPTMLKVDNLLK